MATYKLRFIASDAAEAEALRSALVAVFGDTIALRNPQPGRNPKYADSPNILCYGDLTIDQAQLAQLAQRPAAPVGAPVRRRTKKG